MEHPHCVRPEYPRILVCGGRDFIDGEYIAEYLDALGPEVVIHGKARGADKLAGLWAWRRRDRVTELPFPVSDEEWASLGGRAGHLRNTRMLEEGRPDLVLAFYPGGSGTANMVKQAQAAGVEVWQIPQRQEALDLLAQMVPPPPVKGL